MSNCIIIHWCPGNKERAMDPATRSYDKHRMPRLARKLDKQGIDTKIPLMPDPRDPVYEKFAHEFEKLSIDEETILVGHSCGCAFLVRRLWESKQKVAQLILVAPWKKTDSPLKSKQEFYLFPIDESIKTRVGKIVQFTSDDEEEDGKESVLLYHKALGGKVVELEGYGHFTRSHMGTEEFPELLSEILA